jgi:anti-sigma factor RsiW
VTMQCGRARRLLWPDVGPRDATAEVLAAREHASGCEACQSFLQDMLRIREQVHHVAPRPTAPVEVRDRLFQAIARARTATKAPAPAARLRQILIAGIAALLVLSLSLLGYLVVRDVSGESKALGSIVEDRLRAEKGAGLVSSDSLQVARWLAERLPFAVQVPLFPEARLTGARLLVANHESGAVVEYLVQGRGLTYYVLAGGGVGLPQDVRLSAGNGYRVASWHDAGLTHALVGILPGSKLLELARYCIHQMMV